MKRSVLAAAVAVAFLFGAAHAQTQTLLLRDPALSATNIAFVYAGDIWVADRNGSNPRQLTTDGADGSNPVFSPDGSMIAFSATHNDNKDVYVVSVKGGQPKRLTWHPGDDNVLDWAPDGSAVYFASAREFNRGRSAQLYRVSINGGLPQKQMETRVFRGRFDASGRRFAYDQISPAYDGLYGGWFGWRGYRGGRTPSIAIMDMTSKSKSKSTVKVPGDGVNDLEPMWVGDQVYFLSDRDKGTLNLFHFDPLSKAVTKVSHEDVWDIRAAYAYESVIIYEAGGRLKTLDTASGATAEVPISIHPDLPQMRPQMKDASTTIQSFDLSPTGKRVAVTARGEVFTVPVDEGSTRNLTMTEGASREYTALWSPDGSRIAYVDASKAEQELVIVDQTGLGQTKHFPLGRAFNQLLSWGGDGSQIIYASQRLELYAINTTTGERTVVSASPRRHFAQVDTSPDGRWLAYTEGRPNSFSALRLYDFTTKRSYPVLDDMADVSSPAFSKDGKYLYFAASTNSGPSKAGLDMSAMEKPYRAALYVAVLSADGESPLKPKSGDEPAAAEPPVKPTPTRVDIEGLDRRIEALPVAERNYANLAVAKSGDLYFLRRPQPGAASGPLAGLDPADNALIRFNFATRKDEQVLPGVTAAKMSVDGWHIIAQTPAGLSTIDVRTPTPKPLNLTGLKALIDPRKEWRQMFDEAWLMEKEWFYDPNLHGLDWQAIHDRYAPLVAYVGRREDLNTLLREMLGETQVGHQFVFGGDSPKEPSSNVGLLGADLAPENGHTRIKRIFTGETWNPSAHAPLAARWLNVREGDYILAVNGRDLGAGDEIWEYLQGTAGKQTALRIASSPDGRDARTVTVEPIASEGQLRLAAWVEDNRRAVAKATNGRVGYVYVPDTGPGGFTMFNRMFYAQVDKDGLIVDDRSNDGGSAANYIVDVLSQVPLSGWKGSVGVTFNTPGAAMFGPKVLLVDQDAQSGGDFLAYAFKQRKVGPLIGTRTWGGLIGVSGNPTLIDGGLALVPWYRFFDADGEWTVEGMGVSPDIRVELDPLATNNGRDTQLQAAIAEVQRELAANPPARGIAPKPPPYPTRVGPP